MKVVISIGIGRLHLMQSVSYLAFYDDVKVSLVCGWVPKQSNSFLVRACSKLVGRDLTYGMSKRLEVPDNVKVHTCSVAEFVEKGLALCFFRLGFKRYHAAVIGWKLFGRCSRRFIRNADVFHVRSGAGQGGAISLAKRLGIPVIVDQSIAHPHFMELTLKKEYERNGQTFNSGPDNPFWSWVIKDCQAADILLVNSRFVMDTFVQTGYPDDKIRVVHQGVRSDFFGLKSSYNQLFATESEVALRLLFTGSFSFRKGAEYLLMALRILIQRGVNVVLTVVGSYSEAEPLLLNFEEELQYVEFIGHIPQDELKTHLANADLYVFPSLAEGCASSGMEAMAAGLCVVATQESGLPILDGETGYVVPAMDAETLADKIEWLRQHPSDVKRVGQAAAKLIKEEYTWEHYAEKIRLIYKELCSSSLSV